MAGMQENLRKKPADLLNEMKYVFPEGQGPADEHTVPVDPPGSTEAVDSGQATGSTRDNIDYDACPTGLDAEMWNRLHECALSKKGQKSFYVPRPKSKVDCNIDAVVARTTVNCDTGHIYEYKKVLKGLPRGEWELPLPIVDGKETPPQGYRLMTIWFFDPKYQEPAKGFYLDNDPTKQWFRTRKDPRADVPNPGMLPEQWAQMGDRKTRQKVSDEYRHNGWGRYANTATEVTEGQYLSADTGMDVNMTTAAEVATSDGDNGGASSTDGGQTFYGANGPDVSPPGPASSPTAIAVPATWHEYSQGGWWQGCEKRKRRDYPRMSIDVEKRKMIQGQEHDYVEHRQKIPDVYPCYNPFLDSPWEVQSKYEWKDWSHIIGVARPVSKKELQETQKALDALEKEWDILRKKVTWKIDEMEPWDVVAKRAKLRQIDDPDYRVHV
jgi:hypothetical protein